MTTPELIHSEYGNFNQNNNYEATQIHYVIHKMNRNMTTYRMTHSYEGTCMDTNIKRFDLIYCV